MQFLNLRRELVEQIIFTVIIPCYNQGRFLSKAIESVLGQTHKATEIIVIDDGSTDDTGAIAQQYDGHIHYIKKQNSGVCSARNTGIAIASGEFVLFLDADDYLCPDALEHCLHVAQDNPTADVFYGSWEYVDVNGQSISRRNAETISEDAFHTLLQRNFFPVHCAIVRRSSLTDSGGFDSTIVYYEDWDFWLRLAAIGARFVQVPATIAVYRQHSLSRSQDFNRMSKWAGRFYRNAAKQHQKCPICRTAISRGLRETRGNNFWQLLYPDISKHCANKEVLPLLHKLALACIADPKLICYLFSIVLSKTYRAITP